MNILVINAGSSSLKYQLFDMDNETVLAKGLCERIGIDGHLKHTPNNGKPVFNEDIALPDHAVAIQAVIDKLTSAEYGVVSAMSEIDAVGHRVVHGGEHFAQSTLITDEVMKAIEDCIPLAPLHNPANITGIEACTKVIGNVPQVAVFDTAFHQSMPSKAYTYAVPHKYYDEYKVRRYGFHGTSHRYVTDRAAALLGKPVEDVNIITCHMGNGSSICAVKGGKSVDTSMGFTPIAGLPMGTRCGDLDVSVMEFIMKKDGLDIDAMMKVLNKESGVLGISGTSSDFRDLDMAAEKGDKRAALALDVFTYSVAKTVGAYAVALGKVDAIVFTAGIGENSASVRKAIADQLGVLGVAIDDEKNKVRGEEVDISAADAKVKAFIIPTNEELVLARDTKEIASK
ncbi:MAG: acetate kinase [Oscillospiraceae bacterium]|nr:acetate kinase [Oscillospiraceae bacterium]